jgi:hypothetical protein
MAVYVKVAGIWKKIRTLDNLGLYPYALYGCGYNAQGQINNNSILSKSTPTQIGSGVNWNIICNTL